MPLEVPLFVWSAELDLPLTALNEDHRRIFSLAGQLHEAMLAARGRQEISRLVGALADHTQSHLGREEELMVAHGYPQLEEHRAEHQVLARQVSEFGRRLQAGETTMTIELMHFLAGWLESHIRGSDRRLAEWLRGGAPDACP